MLGAINGITQLPTPRVSFSVLPQSGGTFLLKVLVHRLTGSVQTGYTLLLKPVNFTLAMQVVTALPPNPCHRAHTAPLRKHSAQMAGPASNQSHWTSETPPPSLGEGKPEMNGDTAQEEQARFSSTSMARNKYGVGEGLECSRWKET